MNRVPAAVLDDSVVALIPPQVRATATPVSQQIFLGAVRAGDICTMLAAGIVAPLLMTLAGRAAHWDVRSLIAVVLATAATDRVFVRAGAYTLPRLRGGWTALVSLVLPLLLGTAVQLLISLPLEPDIEGGLRQGFGWLLASGGLLAGSRILARHMLTKGLMARRLSRRIVMFGANSVSQRFIERLHADRSSADRVVAVFDDRRSRIPDVHAGVPVLGRIDDLLAKGREDAIDAVVVALPLTATARLGEVCDALRPSVSDIYVTADLAGDRLDGARLCHLGPNPVITISRRPMDDWAALHKRILDIVVGGSILVMVAPVMCLIALAIRIDSDGPALFRQTRRGLNNRDFVVTKFRTMHHHLGDPSGRRQAVRNDPRVTRVGRLLRQLGFDELPQLFNVLRGDMSLVGPRPHALCVQAGDLPLEAAVSGYAMRHRVKPGITGWAQVNGFRGAIRNEAQLRGRVECDLYYINNWSILFDIKIMFMTLCMKRQTRKKGLLF